MNNEDQESLFHSYPCPYYVQSPSTISHANSNHEISRITLSRHSSSHGSNSSFGLHEKKIVVFDVRSQGTETDEKRLIIVGRDGNDEDEYYYGSNVGLWQRYFSYSKSDSSFWICLQISWRLLVSLFVGLLVFYATTKPPPPKFSVKVAGIEQFVLAEGVDGSGVATNILTCNCSIKLIVENKSNLFGLHIRPPALEMYFGHLPLAISQGPKLYASSYSKTVFQLYVGTQNREMYGAGRSMQDMLQSGKGLSLVIRLHFVSNFRVLWNIINSRFHHHGHCLLLLHNAYGKKHLIQSYNSICRMNSA